MDAQRNPLVITAGTLVGLAVLLFSLTALTFYRAWAVFIMWGWFVVPLGLPALSIPTFAGFLYIYGLFNARGLYKKKKEEIDWWFVFLSPLIVLFFGWVFKHFL